MALERELETYEQQLPDWLAAGKDNLWVVIHGSDVLGFFNTLDAAAEAGYQRFGVSDPFMVRQITQPHAPIHASRRAIDAHHPADD